MKKTLIAFALITAAAWAAPEGNVYHTIADPAWHVTRIGSRWVIEDSRGFFVGYYVPQQTAPAAPVTTAATAPSAPVSPPPAAPDNGSSAYTNNGGYGYGYYNGRYGYGNNAFYGNNNYNNGGYYYNNAGYHPQCPEPPKPQRDLGDVPGTGWHPAIPAH